MLNLLFDPFTAIIIAYIHVLMRVQDFLRLSGLDLIFYFFYLFLAEITI